MTSSTQLYECSDTQAREIVFNLTGAATDEYVVLYQSAFTAMKGELGNAARMFSGTKAVSDRLNGRMEGYRQAVNDFVNVPTMSKIGLENEQTVENKLNVSITSSTKPIEQNPQHTLKIVQDSGKREKKITKNIKKSDLGDDDQPLRTQRYRTRSRMISEASNSTTTRKVSPEDISNENPPKKARTVEKQFLSLKQLSQQIIRETIGVDDETLIHVTRYENNVSFFVYNGGQKLGHIVIMRGGMRVKATANIGKFICTDDNSADISELSEDVKKTIRRLIKLVNQEVARVSPNMFLELWKKKRKIFILLPWRIAN